MTPRRIRLSRAKGWRKPEGAVVVARPSRWGNPFRIGDRWGEGDGDVYVEVIVKDAEKAVAMFRDMLRYPLRPYPSDAEIVAALRGLDLCCWCPLDAPCHADVLLERANR